MSMPLVPRHGVISQSLSFNRDSLTLEHTFLTLTFPGQIQSNHSRPLSITCGTVQIIDLNIEFLSPSPQQLEIDEEKRICN